MTTHCSLDHGSRSLTTASVIKNDHVYEILFQTTSSHWKLADTVQWLDEQPLDRVVVMRREPFLRLFRHRASPLPRHQDLVAECKAEGLFCTLGEARAAHEQAHAAAAAAAGNAGAAGTAWSERAVAFVSHRWETAAQPDPRCEQLRAVVRVLDARADLQFVWFDFWCLPQRREGGVGGVDDDAEFSEEERAYRRWLFYEGGLRSLCVRSSCVPLWSADYHERLWCMAEVVWGHDGEVVVVGVNEASAELRRAVDLQYAKFVAVVL